MGCGLVCNLLISPKKEAVRCVTILGLDNSGVSFGCVRFAIHLFRKRGTQYRAVLQTVYGPGSGREVEGGGAIGRAGKREGPDGWVYCSNEEGFILLQNE